MEVVRIATASPRHRRPILVRTATFRYIEHLGEQLASFVLNANMFGHIKLFYSFLRILNPYQLERDRFSVLEKPIL